MRILVVEDEPKLNELICKTLQNRHYSVDFCLDGEDALSFIDGAEYDAIVLDIMLPRMNGVEILKMIRSEGNKTPVLLLTAMDSVNDRVTGLDAGADDYLTKPFAFEELLARIRALVRRGSDSASNVLTVSDLVADCDSRTVKRGGKGIELTSKEFSLLEYMMRNSGTVLSRNKISQHIWNYDYEGGSNVVDVYIRYLRRKIDDGFDEKLIHTVRGAGYTIKENDPKK